MGFRVQSQSNGSLHAMDAIKIANFYKDHPSERAPSLRPIGDADTGVLRDRLLSSLGLKAPSDKHLLMQTIHSKLEPIEFIDATSERFDLAVVFRAIGVIPQELVYINWNCFEQVDLIAFADLARWFSYIWYPASDDIEIFDQSCSWVVAVRHFGVIESWRNGVNSGTG